MTSANAALPIQGAVRELVNLAVLCVARSPHRPTFMALPACLATIAAIRALIVAPSPCDCTHVTQVGTRRGCKIGTAQISRTPSGTRVRFVRSAGRCAGLRSSCRCSANGPRAGIVQHNQQSPWRYPSEWWAPLHGQQPCQHWFWDSCNGYKQCRCYSHDERPSDGQRRRNRN
jgi:hypothetical protein